ncbi:MAG: methionine--tRNA ligase [Thermaerobacter sp.]|nr:methionine--tRNA ligase [Thermaerobacter sp.]
MAKSTWYLTTPIYYPSDRLHIGHAYTTVAADALARYHRLIGQSVWFVTGSDEHGQKIQRRAEEKGVSAQDFVDDIVGQIKDPLWKRLAISYDDFIRTTQTRHHRVVQAFFHTLQERGDIYKGVYEGWYCLPCETFWTQTKVGSGNCPDCGRPVERVRQQSYFFRLSAYQDRMRQYILDHPEFIQPPTRRNEMLAFLDEGLEDLSISRTGLNWGIPVPGDPEHVIYVWFDALLNYLTAVGYASDPEKFHATWPPDLQLVGKEIVRFHAIIWPIMLMAHGLALPRQVFGHGWLLIGDTKMSKSRGNAVDPLDLIDRYGVDAVRYYLLREVPFGADGSYTEDALVLRTNVDLANDLGNLLHRTVAMIGRFLQGSVALPPTAHPDRVLVREARRVAAAVGRKMDEHNLSEALVEVGQLVRAANRQIEVTQPWNLAKAGRTDALHTVLFDLAETLRVISVFLTPFLVEAPARLRAQLGLHTPVADWGETTFGSGPGRYSVHPGLPLFPRIERDTAPSAEAPTETESVSLEVFEQLKLAVATIVAAEPVAGADRLLKILVDDGERTRTVVSGIRAHYAPETLIGKQVVLVKNLRPQKIRGIVSEGMLLAASQGNALTLVAPEAAIAAGARVQ